MSALPCFVGDADPLLVRAPGSRRTQRVQLFIEFISKLLAARTELLAGLRPTD